MNARIPIAKGLPLILCALAALGAGCASDEERLENADFGDSVRNAIAQQTANPGSTGAGLDGVKATAVLQAYRQDVAQPKSAEKPLLFKIGQ